MAGYEVGYCWELNLILLDKSWPTIKEDVLDEDIYYDKR